MIVIDIVIELIGKLDKRREADEIKHKEKERKID